MLEQHQMLFALCITIMQSNPENYGMAAMYNYPSFTMYYRAFSHLHTIVRDTFGPSDAWLLSTHN